VARLSFEERDDLIPAQRLGAHHTSIKPEPGPGRWWSTAGVSAETLCAKFHKAFPRKRDICYRQYDPPGSGQSGGNGLGDYQAGPAERGAVATGTAMS
jgi:hypothetical protein